MKIKQYILIIAVIFASFLTGCGKSGSSSEDSVLQTGAIEVYSEADHKNYRTTNDELYDRNLLTAAHKNISYDTYLKVTNLSNGYRTTVKINDHNLSQDCVIKVSHEAAKQLGLATGIPEGTTVSLELSSKQ